MGLLDMRRRCFAFIFLRRGISLLNEPCKLAGDLTAEGADVRGGWEWWIGNEELEIKFAIHDSWFSSAILCVLRGKNYFKRVNRRGRGGAQRR